MQIRTRVLKEELSKSGLNGYIITYTKNVYYFTGFLDIPDAKQFLVVSLDGEPTLFTNPLSYSAACEKATGCTVRLVKSSEKIWKEVSDQVRLLKLTRVGFDNMDISLYLKMIKNLRNVDFQPRTELVWKLRRVKSDEEIGFVKRAAEFADAGMKAGLEAVRAGAHEYEVAAEAEYEMRTRGSEGTAFETIVASGPRSAHPHGVCSDRVIRQGDLVILDIGGVYKGYKSDLTRTFVAGKPSSKQEEIFNLVLQAQNQAFQQIKADIKASDLDGIARKAIEEKGYRDEFLHGLGHGVGLNIHEPPMLSKSSKDIIEEGNVITVEPGIYIQGFGGVRIEDTVLVLRGNGQKLTKTPYTLMI